MGGGVGRGGGIPSFLPAERCCVKTSPGRQRLCMENWWGNDVIWQGIVVLCFLKS